MKLRIKCSFSELCFYVFWFCLQLGKGLGYVAEDTEFLKLLLLGAPFAFVKLFLTKWTAKELLTAAALAVLGIGIAISSGVTTFLLTIFCIVAVKDIDIKKALKINLFVRGPLYAVRTTMAILGYTDMQMRYRYEAGVAVAERYAMGYGHPNSTQFELFMLIALIVILYANRIKFLHYICFALSNHYIYGYTDSRTPYVLCVVFLAGAYLARNERERIINRLIDFWSNKSWYIGIIVSAIGCWAYVRIPLFRQFGTFSSRFLTAVNTITENNITLFGMEGISTDLGFVYLLYCAGLVYFILYIIWMHRLLKLGKMRYETLLQWAFVCLSIFNMMEHTAYSVLSNGLLLYLVYVIFPRQNKEIISKTMRKEESVV